ETVEVPMAALLMEDKGKVLVRKRPQEEKWLKGMWEFPSVEGKTFEEALGKLEKILKVKVERKGIHEVRHQITHHKIHLRLFRVPNSKLAKLPKDYQWATSEKLVKFP